MTDFIETRLRRIYQLLVYFDADVDLGVADSLFSLATVLLYVKGMATALWTVYGSLETA